MTFTIEPDRVLTAKELTKFCTPVKERPCAVTQIVRAPGAAVDISRAWLFNNPGGPRTAKSCALLKVLVPRFIMCVRILQYCGQSSRRVFFKKLIY